MQHVTAAALKL